MKKSLLILTAVVLLFSAKAQETETETKLYLVDKVAELTISAGLVVWVIRKTS